MKVCSKCGADWGLHGKDYKRKDCNGYYHKCSICNSSSEPIESSVDGSRILVIPDLHAPFMHVDAIGFLKRIEKKYNCNKIVMLGDELDMHYSSFHETDPDGMSANAEMEVAVRQLTTLAKEFPNMDVCLGNHTAIPARRAFTAGLSNRWIKTPKEILLELGAPVEGWNYADSHTIGRIKFTHGIARKAKQRMLQDGISIVQGHYHSESYIWHHVNDVQKLFAMQLGALIDDSAYTFSYGRHYAKSHKNCGVIIDGVPIIEYMDLGSKVVTG
jgi:metallophosphoesterase superfamily enzyme